MGDDGVRSGWSILLFITLMAALLSGVRVSGRLNLGDRPPAVGTEIGPDLALSLDLPLLLATVLVTWVMSKIEGRRVSVYGIGAKRAFPDLFAGLTWGFACLSLLVLVLRQSGLLVFEGRLLFGADALRHGAIWLLVFLVAGACEEYLARGYLLFTMTRGFAGLYAWLLRTRYSIAFGFWTAAFLLSTLFGLGHHSNPGESPIGLLSACLFSLLFCLSLWRTGSLWWAIGYHSSWDWAQSFLYGVGDSGYKMQNHLLGTHPVGPPVMSGGSVGPEGSVFMLAVFALAAAIVIFTLPRAERGVAIGGASR